jgi:hypothetical protein
MTTVQLPVQLWCDYRATGGPATPLYPRQAGTPAPLRAVALGGRLCLRSRLRAAARDKYPTR